MEPRVRVPAKAKGGSMNTFGSEGPSDSGFVDIEHEGEWPEAEPSEGERYRLAVNFVK